jgi:arabinose-5-phosphate isomerase
VVSITGSDSSPIARASDVAIDGSVTGEADSHNLAPSCSTTVALVLGDALAFAVMEARQLPVTELARHHPGGWIGKLFRITVAEAMAQDDRVAWVRSRDPLARVLEEITRCGLGCACVVAEAGDLEGLVTDGDIRRALQRHIDIDATTASDIMTREPVTIAPDASLYEAMRLMEDRPSQISVVPVVDGQRCVGVIRLHDIHQAALL